MTISLTREVRVCLGLPPSEHHGSVTNSWVGGPSTDGLAVPLRVRLTVTRDVDPRTGYIEDIAAIDGWVRQAFGQCGGSLADGQRAEAWLPGLFRRLNACGSGKSPRLTFTCLELVLSPEWSFAIRQEDPHVIRVTRQFEFSAAHRLHSPQLSDEQNRITFGKCNFPHGHGHNYCLDVTLEGTPDVQTQTVLRDAEFDRIVKELVIQRLDHRFLNIEVAEFRDLNPTVENIAQTVWNWLDGQFAPANLAAVRVYETPKTWAEVQRP